MRAYLWTMLALESLAVAANLHDIWSAKPRLSTEQGVRRTSAIALVIACGLLFWTVSLL